MISIIINHRGIGQRLNNLKKLVSYYLKFNTTKEIIVVEQDSKPKIQLPNINHLFVHNPGLFSRSWGFNVGYKYSSYENLVFADADFVVSEELFMESINKLNECGVVQPYDRCIGLKRQDRNKSIEEILKITSGDKFRVTYGGGTMMFTRTAFEKIKGWDERFEGWGYEDNHTGLKVRRILKKSPFTKGLAFHQWHEVQKSKTWKQPQLKKNKELFRKHKYSTTEQIFDDIADVSLLGDLGKYSK